MAHAPGGGATPLDPGALQAQLALWLQFVRDAQAYADLLQPAAPLSTSEGLPEGRPLGAARLTRRWWATSVSAGLVVACALALVMAAARAGARRRRSPFARLASLPARAALVPAPSFVSRRRARGVAWEL